MENLQNDLAITTVIDIEPDNEIMMYIAYGVTDISVDENGQYVGTYTDDSGYTYTCYIVVTEGIVERVYYRDTQGNGIEVKGTPIGEIGNKVGSLTEDMSITSIIDIEPDSTIMMYIGYGISNVQAVADRSYAYTGTYTDENGVEHTAYIETVTENGQTVVGRAYYIDNGEEVAVSGTKIADIGDQVDGLTATLTIVEIIGEENINADDRILGLVADSTIENLSDTIASLTVQEMYAEEIYGDNQEGAGENGWITATQDNFDPAYLYYTYDDVTDKYILAGNNGHLDSLPSDGTTYYTRGKATGIWYLLLYTDGSEVSYSVNNMGDMMTAAVSNLNEATLQDFVDAGIITGDITGEIPTGGTLGNLTWMPIADMTIDELLEAVNFISELLR